MDHWKRTESSEINPHMHSHLINDKGNTEIQWRRIIWTNGAGETGYPNEKKKWTWTSLSHYIAKINSK